MTDELHDLLHAAVPDPPAAPDRAALARDRARRTRRRTAAVLGLAAAVLVGATATVPTLVDDRLDPAGPRPIRAPIPTPAAVHIACPAPDEPTHGPGTVLPGAVAIRLCPGPGISFDAPADVLVSDVDRVAETINRQATGPFPSLPCQMDLGRGYQLVFGYPDGHTQNVAGELYGCHTLTVGGVVRSNPEKPFATFIRLLRSQRAHEQPPSNPTSGPPCPQGGLATLSPVGRAREMVAATLCVRWPTETEHAPVAVAVPDADLATLLADRMRRPDPSLHDPTYDPQAPELTLVGETAWGDTVSVGIESEWWPGPRARAVLDALVASAERPAPTVDASSTASDVVAAYVDLLNAGDRKGAAALWHDRAGRPDVPTAYSHVDAKVESERRLPSVSAWRDATAVTALYRVVPPDRSFTDYREAVFTLGRDDAGILRIVHLDVGEVVPTGR